MKLHNSSHSVSQHLMLCTLRTICRWMCSKKLLADSQHVRVADTVSDGLTAAAQSRVQRGACRTDQVWYQPNIGTGKYAASGCHLADPAICSSLHTPHC